MWVSIPVPQGPALPEPQQGPSLPEHQGPEEEGDDPWYRDNFVAVDTPDLVTLLDPEVTTLDEIEETFNDLISRGARADHGVIPGCSVVRAFYLDHFEYFAVRGTDYLDHSDFVNFHWDQPYSE